ncbi:MAG: GAF domain-containing protein, partial [Candidatus Limnocylindrales bacterium]|nr:GAF domain-containing protein [Candidatus Limnocylindrales bacterium]
MPNSLQSRPVDATLSVTKAARLLGVHPNTIRTWSDAGRLRYFRINARGDRRYRLGDLQRFLAAAKPHPTIGVAQAGGAGTANARRPAAHGGPADAGGHARLQGQDATADPLDAERHRLDLAVASTIARIGSGVERAGEPLLAAAQAVRHAYGHHLVAIWAVRGDRLMPCAVASSNPAESVRLTDLPRRFGILGAALDAGDGRDRRGRGMERRAERGALLTSPLDEATLPVLPGGRPELAVPIPGGDGPWGVLLIVGEGAGSLGQRDLEAARVVADGVAALVEASGRAEEIAHLRHRAEALRRVASDIGGRLDLERILSGLVDHAMVLFEGDGAAVLLRDPDGRITAEVSRGLSAEYLKSVREFPARSLPAAAVAARRPLFSVGYRDDPRGADMRAAVVQEGFDTLCTAPLIDGGSVLGLLNIYHDRPHPWTEAELETVEALATQAGVAIRAAQDYERMATWAAQLQSIQQLGVRLNRLSSVTEIGMAIATELRQLIDYHNARVYRLVGQELMPVAMQGQVGEYIDETPDQLRVTIGEGITGWVAANRVAQNLGDAAADPRVNTIPGTEEDLDESMLLAPMLFDDQVLGVLVLSKLGLNRFSDDDLRLLVIYASFAAQAMANADTTERLRHQSLALERQLRSQRELLQITESLLTTLDAKAVLESITERLGGLIACDNIAIEVVDPVTGRLTPRTARGSHEAFFMEPWAPGETGVATWVVQHDEPVYIRDERDDPRVNRRDDVPNDGSLIVVPLRSRGGAVGVLTIERLGIGNTFSFDEFELVQLFAAQVSIALQNAEVFQAVQVRARTDGLTGLLNHATFEEWLERFVREGASFSLIMLDLDDFRDVNNSRGHQAGDEVLRSIAAGLVRAGRDTDLVFRYGGDEFAFLLPHTDGTGALLAAERARQAVLATDGAVSASVGVATFPADGSTPAEI